MGVPVRFTPLCGARVDGGPLAHLLEIGPPGGPTLTLLLDCGWCPAAPESDLAPLIEALPRVDAVLLSHADPRHAGALPIAIGKHGLAAPVYGTSPIARMGAMFAYDIYLSAQATSDFTAYDLDDVDRAFSAVKHLKFTQSARLRCPAANALASHLGCDAIRVTPFAAGHLLGGCVWRVELAGEEIVYAVDTNHRKERHLPGCSLETVTSRPALLVVDAASSGVESADRARREGVLLDALMGALRQGGNVLLPVDTAGRVLELMLVLDAHWEDNNLRDTYPLVALSSVGPSTLEFAQASLEWMADGVTRAFETGRGNPFRLKNVRQFGSMHELQSSPLWRSPRPLVVLATGPNLDPGSLSREVLLQWAREPRALTLLTQRPRPGSLAAALAAHQAPGPLHIRALPCSRRVPLEGSELESWETAKRQEAEAAAEAAAAAEADAAAAATSAGAGGGQLALRSSSAAISQLVRGAGGEVVQLLPGVTGGGEDALAAAAAVGGGDATLMEGFVPPPGAAAPMFPDEDEVLAATWDVYGEIIDPEAWRKLGGAEAAASDEPGDEELAAAEEDTRPTKVVTEAIDLHVAARTATVDFEGRSDSRGLRTIVSQVAPRQLVVIGAGAAPASELAAAWSEDLARLRPLVVAPGLGEGVDMTVAAGFAVSLHPRLLSGAHTHLLGQYHLTWLDGRLAAPDDVPAAAGVEGQQRQLEGEGAGGLQDAEMAEASAPASDQQRQEEQQQQSADTAGAAAAAAAGADGATQLPPPAHPLRLLPGGVDVAALEAALQDGGPEAAAALLAAAVGGDHGGIFIGDVKLSEVKQALARAGIPSAFRAGKLLCAGAVVVSRGVGGEDGALEIEGPLSDDYYRIRDVVYAQYQVC